jgi:hypothetical protein
VRAASKRTYIKKIKRKTATSKGVSIDRIEHNFNIVLSHLRQVGTYKQTLAKHNALVIYSCVRRCLENSESDMLDLAIEFEHLRDYDNIDDFIEHLEKQHSVSKTYSDATLEDMALTELKEHAEILNKQIISKHEIAVSRQEYAWLKICERTYKKHLNGWPLSLS